MLQRPVSVLVVDDHDLSVAAIRGVLVKDGFAVSTAEDGERALDLLRDNKFDLMLLDLLMPGMDGLELLHRLAPTRDASAPKIIMLSAVTESDQIIEALKLGASDYVTKPVDYPVLLARMETLLAQREMEILLRDTRDKLENGIAVLKERIVEQAVIEESLRERERGLDAILSNIVEGIITIDEKGVIQSFNPAAEKMFNYAADAVIGKNVSILMPEPDRSRHDGYISNYLKTGQGKIIDVGFREIEARRQDGSRFPGELAISDMTIDGKRRFIGTIRDITQRKESETALQESEERFGAIAQSIDDAIIAVDDENRIIQWNTGAVRIFGYEESEVIGQPLMMVIPERYRERHATAVAHVKQTGKTRLIGQSLELAGLRKDGSEFPAEISVGTWTAAGKTFFSGIIRDITQRKEVELQIRARSEQLDMISALGFQALGDPDLKKLFAVSTRAITQVFSVEMSKILLFTPEGSELQMVAGCGWNPGLAGKATVGIGLNSQAGYTLHSKDAVVVEDLRTETRFNGPPLLRDHGVVSGVSVIIGDRKRPFGVLGAHTTRQRAFTNDEVNAMNSIASLLASAIDRERATSKMEASETRLRGAIESLQEGFALFDADDRLVMINDNFRHINPKAQEHLERGLTFVDVIRSNIESGHIIDAAGREEEFIAERLRQHRNLKGPIIRRHSDGNTYMIMETATPEGGIALTFSDITELMAAQQDLTASKEQFRAVVDHMPNAVYLKDMDGRYVLVNKAFEDWYGLPIKEARGKTAFDLFPKDLAEGFWEHDLEVLETCHVVDVDREIPRMDGAIRHVNVIKFPIFNAAGDLVGLCGLNTDITERMQAEAQLVQADKLATLGRMASNIAHEMNQPLNVIRMAAESSIMGLDDGTFGIDAVRTKLGQIDGQAQRMAEIIDHMRVLAREDKSRVEAFSPLERLQTACDFLDEQFATVGIRLERNFPPSSRPVSGRPVRFEQVVLNLLANARDAVEAKMASSDGKGPRWQGRVTVRLSDDKRRKTLAIAVSDNGGGIRDDDLAQVFDPFFTTKDVGVGTGLGLSISQGIIQSMGGELEVANTRDGTRFTISLPALREAAAEKKPKTEARPGAAKPSPTANACADPGPRNSPTVLVVDDEELAVQCLAEHLERKGFRVATAGDGAEALKLYRAQPADAVVTDLRMPKMDGNELIRRLREISPDLPIFVTTGHTNIGDDKETVSQGATAVLKKPVSLRDITKRLEAATGGDAAEGAG